MLETKNHLEPCEAEFVRKINKETPFLGVINLSNYKKIVNVSIRYAGITETYTLSGAYKMKVTYEDASSKEFQYDGTTAVVAPLFKRW